MKQQARILLAAALGAAAGLSSLNANTFIYSQKNFMANRPALVNAPLEYQLWHDHAYDLRLEGLRTSVQAVAYYQKSQQADDLGAYFGVNKSNSFKVGTTNDVATGVADIDGTLLIHQNGIAPANQLSGTETFSPYQEKYGLRLDYFQDITHRSCKLFFRASAPIEHVATSMNPSFSASTPVVLPGAEGTFSLADFFAGRVNVTTPGSRNLQSPLTKAKIAGRQRVVGLADLDLSLGYKWLDKEDKHVYVSFDVTVPTGNKVRGNYLFEPVCGNGKHVGLGGRIHTGFELWKSEHANIQFKGSYRYSYLLEATESRTLSLLGIPSTNGQPAVGAKFSQYDLVGQFGQVAGTALFPAANILTMPLTVKPGSMLETMSIVSFNCSSFTVDAGINSFWKDQESVWVKSFADNVYGVANAAFNTTLPATTFVAPAGNAQDLTPIARANLDVNSVKTPALLTFKPFAGFGYTFHICKKYPASVGVGASYEFETSNADIENYQVWLKTCFSF